MCLPSHFPHRVVENDPAIGFLNATCRAPLQQRLVDIGPWMIYSSLRYFGDHLDRRDLISRQMNDDNGAMCSSNSGSKLKVAS